MNDIEIISAAQVFKGLNDECKEKIAGMSKYKKLREGVVLFNQGERTDGMYVIGSGEIEVFCSNRNGKEQVMHLLGVGELCAEIPLFQGGSYPASARAYSDAEVCYVDGGEFLDFACENPEILLEMLAVISLRTKKFLKMIENLSLKDVTQRLATYLWKNKDENNVFRLGRSKIELASELSTIPETLSRSIKKLLDTKAIEVISKDKKSYKLNIEMMKEFL